MSWSWSFLEEVAPATWMQELRDFPCTPVLDSNDYYHHDNYNKEDEEEEEEAMHHGGGGVAGDWRRFLYRFLAEQKPVGRIDYSVLSVTVMTLGLIMVVEFLKHRLEHAALGRPYFSTVLENIYGELSTLGIVEFFVFLLQQYHTSMNKEKKGVFADVHFALFYTAVLNAIQSILLAFMSNHVSYRLWVQTEELELNHYIEVREEFDRVRAALFPNDKMDQSGEQRDSPGEEEDGKEEDDKNKVSSSTGPPAPPPTNFVGGYNHKSRMRTTTLLRRRLSNLISRPNLMHQYNNLLIQVRFHELRVHFLQSYNLPPNLKISDYLIRCNQAVLIKLIHVSIVAWLLLTASANILYYVLGVVGYFEESAKAVGLAMTYVFFSSMTIFIVLALMVYYKMESVFRTIMHRPDLWETNLIPKGRNQRQLAMEQMALFWGKSPKLIIAAIQFMQFGYAVALSVVIIFWDVIDDGDIALWLYVMAIGICYSIFVLVAARVIPLYTLCTSLAQLVDKKRLNETVASFHLKETKRRRQAEMYFFEQRQAAKVRFVPTIPPDDVAAPGAGSSYSKTLSSTAGSILSEDMTMGHEVTIADLVNMDTASSERRTTVEGAQDFAVGMTNRSCKTKLRHEHHGRQKSVSDGVAFMTSLKEYENEEEKEEVKDCCDPLHPDRVGQSRFAAPKTRALDDNSCGSALLGPQRQRTTRNHGERGRRRRQKSKSDGVAAMAMLTNYDDESNTNSLCPFPLPMEQPDSSERIAELVKVDTAALRNRLSKEERQRLEEMEQLKREKNNRRRIKSTSDPDKMEAMISKDDSTLARAELIARKRHNRKRSVSDGVQFMAAYCHTATTLEPFTSQGSIPFEEILISSPDLGEGQNLTIKDKQGGNGADDGDGGDNDSGQTQVDIDESDNFSDVDDIPVVDTARLNEYRRVVAEQAQRPKTITLQERLKDYFLSKRFPLISNLFGTMVSFFLLGSRVERFLHTEEIVSRFFFSFDINETVTFWMLSSIFFFFLVFDGLVYWSVDPLVFYRKYRVVWLASMMDAVLVSVCFAVLYIAESQRCCHPSLTEDNSNGNDPYPGGSGTTYGPAPCGCPAFGSRLYGGLGTIEPWASLVGLRVFRFKAAKRLVLYMHRKRGIQPTDEDDEDDIANEENLDPFNVYNSSPINMESHHGNSHHDDTHGSHGDIHAHDTQRGTAAELWESAIARHPEVAAKYGIFSAEILQCMLDLPLRPPEREDHQSDTSSEPPRVGMGQGICADFLDESPERVPGLLSGRPSYSLDKKYKDLPLGAQEIIMQGQLGKTVIPINSQLAGVHSIPEEDETDRQSSYVFQINEDPSIAPSFDLDHQLPFDAPNAQLVRSMRRCDRKLVPILNKWSPVDVVLTRFEIVYFDATEWLEGPEVEATRLAVKSTKGGKGLRLKDVAVGRKVVGHLLLSDITSMAIERYMPSDEQHDLEESAVENEFWKPEAIHFSRNQAWLKVKQDTLAVHTKHGNTLYLRFYSDLEDAESHPERMEVKEDTCAPIYKNNAFQWVLTLGRLCGPAQLQQSLPHFGDDSDEELRDYLVVHEEGALKKNVMLLAHYGANIRSHETVTVANTSLRHASTRIFARASMVNSLRLSGEIMTEPEEEGVDSALASAGTSANASAKRSLFGRSQSLCDEGDRSEEMTPSSPGHPTRKPLFGRSSSSGESKTPTHQSRASATDSVLLLPPLKEHTELRKVEDDSPV